MSPTDSDLTTWKSTVDTVQSFDQLSNFLQKSAADTESTQLSASMGELSKAVEVVNEALKASTGDDKVGTHLVGLLAALRKHRGVVIGLSPSWRGLYEYASYLAALNNFRVLVGRWLLDRNLAGALAIEVGDFELIGWRTLGEGILMIDMHEQARASAMSATDIGQTEQHLSQAKNWWSKLRG